VVAYSPARKRGDSVATSNTIPRLTAGAISPQTFTSYANAFIIF